MTNINSIQKPMVSTTSKMTSMGKVPQQSPQVNFGKENPTTIMDGLNAAAIRAKALIHKTPKEPVNKTQATHEIIYKEQQRLENSYVETIEQLKGYGHKPKINEYGLLMVGSESNIPYSGVIKNDENHSLVEYKDGKPVTVIIQDGNPKHNVHKLIKYEYPKNSSAVIKTELSTSHEMDYKLPRSLVVPREIQEEVGLNL